MGPISTEEIKYVIKIFLTEKTTGPDVNSTEHFTKKHPFLHTFFQKTGRKFPNYETSKTFILSPDKDTAEEENNGPTPLMNIWKNLFLMTMKRIIQRIIHHD